MKRRREQRTTRPTVITSPKVSNKHKQGLINDETIEESTIIQSTKKGN
jgi:hypothetical protein